MFLCWLGGWWAVFGSGGGYDVVSARLFYLYLFDAPGDDIEKAGGVVCGYGKSTTSKHACNLGPSNQDLQTASSQSPGPYICAVLELIFYLILSPRVPH